VFILPVVIVIVIIVIVITWQWKVSESDMSYKLDGSKTVYRGACWFHSRLQRVAPPAR